MAPREHHKTIDATGQVVFLGYGHEFGQEASIISELDLQEPISQHQGPYEQEVI